MTPRCALHLIASLGGGGAEHQLTILAPALAARGIDVHVGLLRGGPYLERLQGSAVAIHMLPPLGHRNPTLAWHISRLAREVDADVVHTWLPLMDVWGGIGARLAGRAWLLGERGEGVAYNGYVRHFGRQLVGRLAHLVVANSLAGSHYWERCGVPASRCSVVPNAVDVEEIGASLPPGDIEAITGGRPLILWVGRLATEKNAERLIDALAIVAPRAEFRALFCGQGPLHDPLRARIASYGLSDHVKLAGFRNDIPALMPHAAMFVSVSVSEGQPNAVLEAMAGGCPLVVSDIPGHREILTEQTAVFVPSGDASAIAEAIVTQLAAPDAAREMARRARVAVLPFTAMAVADRYLSLYDQLLDNRSRAASPKRVVAT